VGAEAYGKNSLDPASVEIIVFCNDFHAASLFFSSAGNEGSSSTGEVRRN
jgi:hypothetical protein